MKFWDHQDDARSERINRIAGFDPYSRTPYYTEAIYALLYGSTPGPSSITGAASNAYAFFPFNDDEHFHDGGAINLRSYLGDFATYFGTRSPAAGNARHARAWRARSAPSCRPAAPSCCAAGTPAARSAAGARAG